VTAVCNGISKNYKLSPDELCPSALIVSEKDDTTSDKTIELTPVKKTNFYQNYFFKRIF
jgi:hypothetical protein